MCFVWNRLYPWCFVCVGLGGSGGFTARMKAENCVSPRKRVPCLPVVISCVPTSRPGTAISTPRRVGWKIVARQTSSILLVVKFDVFVSRTSYNFSHCRARELLLLLHKSMDQSPS